VRIGLVLLFATLPLQAHPERAPVAVAFTADVGYGNEVFVTGGHPDFTSGGAFPHGIKLAWSPGNVWRGTVALPSGTTLSHRFVARPGDNGNYCSGSSTQLSGTLTMQTPAATPPPYNGKTIRYTSAWSEAFILFRDREISGPWTELPMRDAGPGRNASERLYEIRGIGTPGGEIEFVFRNAANTYDNAPAPPENTPQGAAPARPAPYQNLAPPYNYRTRLDVIHVQGGQVFNYPPPASPSAPRIVTRTVDSTAPTIPGRTARIYLPRGYDENTWKRYPVAYFHDGQNVFFPGGPFGTWDADRIATYEISQGRMREAILVAIDNGNAYGSNRLREYLPPSDALSGTQGAADRYLQFLADNVLPTLDFNYRTLNPPGQPARPAENIVAGSSMGGLASSYIALSGSGRFGVAGIFSPAFATAPNFYGTTLLPAPKLPCRFYLDIGSVESSGAIASSAVYWNDAHAFYNALVADGYAVNSELLFWPECGAVHNENAWSRRLPAFFAFALDPWREPQPLALDLYPPRVEIAAAHPSDGRATVEIVAPFGVPITLERTSDFLTWSGTATRPAPDRPWERLAFDETFPTAPRQFWRARYPHRP
jgi:predicted alpha/beta superfamily hydrolase